MQHPASEDENEHRAAEKRRATHGDVEELFCGDVGIVDGRMLLGHGRLGSYWRSFMMYATTSLMAWSSCRATALGRMVMPWLSRWSAPRTPSRNFLSWL